MYFSGDKRYTSLQANNINGFDGGMGNSEGMCQNPLCDKKSHESVVFSDYKGREKTARTTG